jgi:histone acetyltransferase (RNA polymerase elongator complex component)
MKIRHFTIPAFIPELACPFQCIYCNQKKISGQISIPEPDEIIKTIEEHLSTIPKKRSFIEFGFFGGNFTGISLEKQEELLKLIDPYIKNSSISSIRLSTRPDYINRENLILLKKYNVRTIELGAQSMDDDVLKKSKRGHTSKDIINAAKMIKSFGFDLGLQMMIGLPGDTYGKSVFTANQIVKLGADNTRIYPTLVIKDTKLEELYSQKKYHPLKLKEAIEWSKTILMIFEQADVKVIRMGLHPSENLLSGKDIVAGPFHKSFRELVLTEIWNEILKHLLKKEKAKRIRIFVPLKEFNYAIGYDSKNKNMLLENFEFVIFQQDQNLEGRRFTYSIE